LSNLNGNTIAIVALSTQPFGGRALTNLSGKTDFLLVEQYPGRSVVSTADPRGVPLVDLLLLQHLLMGTSSMEEMSSVPPPCTAFGVHPYQKVPDIETACIVSPNQGKQDYPA
jgi:hypothetical protein